MEAARDGFLSAAAIHQSIIETAGENSDSFGELARLHVLLAKCYAKLGEPAHEGAYLRSAYDIRSQSLTANPRVTECHLDLVISQINLAAWFMRQRSEQNDRQALVLLRDAQEILARLHDSGNIDPGSSRYEAYVSALNENLDVLDRRGAVPPGTN